MKTISYLFINTALVLGISSANADQVTQDDSIVIGSTCIGTDCTENIAFGTDTILLKENNLRIKFEDTSSEFSFPTNDWQISINDTTNGGVNYFAIEDVDAGNVPFYLSAGAPTGSIRLNSNGHVGFGTTTPTEKLHVTEGDTPTLRLEQDITSGWGEQTWDVAGNETNFFIRDVTNGSTLPFRIISGAPDASVYIAADGNIGFKTKTPNGLLDIASPANANNHAFIVTPSGNVGINIDDGSEPLGLLDVQTRGGVSRFRVENSGDIMLSDTWRMVGTASGSFTIESTNNTSTKIELNDDGSIVIGDGLTVDASGNVTVRNLTVTGTCTGC